MPDNSRERPSDPNELAAAIVAEATGESPVAEQDTTDDLEDDED